MIPGTFSVLNTHTMTKEIGSEFWLEQEPSNLMQEQNGLYVLSGRTAIDLIIQDLLQKRPVRKVYMPAYGCDSMVMPFMQRGIQVECYDMIFDGSLHYDVDIDKDTDIFYVSNYFGYENTLDASIIEQFRSQGAVILYDRTHSFLMDDDCIKADYSFASIRKWMGVVCGAKVMGVEKASLKTYPYLEGKEKAMRIKAAYIQGDTSIDKKSFLDLYTEFGHHLAKDYRDYAMDDLSYTLYQTTDWNNIRRQRRENAKHLQDDLHLSFLCELTEKACPLFVPVFFDTTEERNRIRKRLIDAQIYCPIHWPKNALISHEMKVNHIFDTELSLICDQRYGLEDMQRIIEIINE